MVLHIYTASVWLLLFSDTSESILPFSYMAGTFPHVSQLVSYKDSLIKYLMQFKIEKLGKKFSNRCLVSIYCVFTAGRITSWAFPKKKKKGLELRVSRGMCAEGLTLEQGWHTLNGDHSYQRKWCAGVRGCICTYGCMWEDEVNSHP